MFKCLFRQVARASEAVRPEVFVSENPREAAPPLHHQLLEEQPALPLLPLLPGHHQHCPILPQSLLLQELLHALRVHTKPVLPALQSLR